ncbi:hypothetical protein [Chitiniphilus eburneus]|uniref:hypothetical protein n=1 Tax=Chitiniphilus eburneus TaxID=2571148 RepID=UPI0035D0BABB
MADPGSIIDGAQTSLAAISGQITTAASQIQSVATSPPIFVPGEFRQFVPSFTPGVLNLQRQEIDAFKPANGGNPLDGVTFPAELPVAPQTTAPTTPDLVPMGEVEAPIVYDVDLPNAPAVSFGARPDALALSIPGAPTVLLTDLDPEAYRLADDLPPVPHFAVGDVEREFEMALTEQEFAGWLQVLWRGDNLDDGHRLFEAGRDRLVREGARTIDDVANQFSARGLRVASPLLAGALAEVGRATAGAVAELNRDLTLKRADQLQQQQLQVTATGLQFIDLLKRYAAMAMERALQVQRMQIEAAQAQLAYAVQRYNARNEQLRTVLAAYTEDRQTALGRIEVYAQQIQAERLKVDINAQQLQAWEAELRAEQMKVQLYSELMRGVQLVTEVNRSRVDVYRATVEAEATRYSQNELNVRLYEALWRGEQSKASVFGEQVRAHAAAVQAASAQVDARTSALRAEVAAYEAYVQGAQANNQTEVQAAQLTVEQDRLRAELDRTLATALMQYNQVLAQQEGQVRATAISGYEGRISALAAAMQTLGGAAGAASSAIAGVAQVTEFKF